MSKHVSLILGPIIAVLGFCLSYFTGVEFKIAATLAITLLTAVWWVTEALPIPMTSLVPFVLFPLFGVLDHKAVASALGSHVIILLMGAFMLSKALEKSGVHHRLALSMVSLFGADKPKRVVFGFMVTAAALSMWVSNTATTLMLLPIALAVSASTGNKRFAVVLLLGIAYAASLGGIATPIGTPPNVIFMGIYEQEFGTAPSFVEWMSIGLPIVLCGLPLMALWLTRGLKLSERLHLPKVEQWHVSEKRVLTIFVLTAFAWIFRKEPFGGWSGVLGLNSIGDSTIALAAVVIMAITPNGKVDEKGLGDKVLDWKTASSIPWGMLLLFAGGICIAKAFQASGLSLLLGDMLTGLAEWPPYLMILLICLTVTFLTEITSNTATTALLMPILAVAGIAAGINPMLLMVPAAISASCAFMLPVATAPNAVVYGSDKFTIKIMAREGFALNVLLAGLISVLTYVLI